MVKLKLVGVPRVNSVIATRESRASSNERGLCCFPGLGSAARGRGEEALLLERQGRASQQTRSSSLPPPPSALPRPPRKPSARNAARYDRLDHRDKRKDSDGSGSIASTTSRGSPLPYESARKLPSVATSSSLPAAESRESLVRSRDSSLPSQSKLAVYAAARRRSTDSVKDKRTHHYRIQF